MSQSSFPEPLDPLTDRETEVLRLLADGHSNKEVAAQLVISVGTVKWYVQQIYSKLGVKRRTQAITRASELNILENKPERRLSSRHKSNIPVQTTSFIGREVDIYEVRQLLLEEQDCRLLTILGPGGIGKSRLALTTSTALLSEMPDGVYFVPLAPLSDAADIVPAIAQSLRFTFYGKVDPTEQLLVYLQSKKLLLVLDNFEHLLEGVNLLPEILKRASDVLLLTTSRERLNLREEWVYSVGGLSYPSTEDLSDNPETQARIETYEAVQLFSQRARQADTNFVPTHNSIDIARICQLVEGMPLALELASGWVRTISCHEIALEIEQNLDFLTTSQSNVLTRHQSLRVVIEQTWRRLPVDEASVLSQLSVSRGGCTREGAKAVTGATLTVLSSLIDKALLRRTDTGRYEIHELIRQFSAEQLGQDADQVRRVQEQLREYYVSLLEARTADVKGKRQKESLTEIRADIDNVRLAWRNSVAQIDEQAIERAAECLFIFYLYSSGHYEGQITFKQAFAVFIEGENNAPAVSLHEKLVVREELASIAGMLLACQGYFLGRTIDPFTGETLIQHALTLIRQAKDKDHHKEGFALQWLGWMLALQGRSADVLAIVAPTLAILRETGDRWSEAWALLNWANILNVFKPLEAEEVYQQGMAVCREIGDRSNLGYYCQTRSACNANLGRFAMALELAEEAVSIFTAMDSVLGLGYALRNRGALALLSGDYEQGIHDLQQAVANFSEVRTEFNVIWAQCYLGTALRMRGDYRDSEQLYQRALNAATLHGYKGHMIASFVGLGCLEQIRGNWDRAEHYHRDALAVAKTIGEDVTLARVHYHLGLALVDAGDERFTEARAYFRLALERSVALNLAPIALSVCAGIAKLFSSSGQPQYAAQLATLAEAHESSTYETRELAR